MREVVRIKRRRNGEVKREIYTYTYIDREREREGGKERDRGTGRIIIN